MRWGGRSRPKVFEEGRKSPRSRLEWSEDARGFLYHTDNRTRRGVYGQLPTWLGLFSFAAFRTRIQNLKYTDDLRLGVIIDDRVAYELWEDIVRGVESVEPDIIPAGSSPTR